MPAVVALPAFWGAVGAVGAGTGAIVAGKMQSGAVRKGAQIQANAADAALAEAKRQDALDRAQYQKEWEHNLALDQDRIDKENAAIARRQALMDEVGGSLRAFGGNGGSLTQLAPATTTMAAAPPPMPKGWKPGDPIPAGGDLGAGNPSPAADVAPSMPSKAFSLSDLGPGTPPPQPPDAPPGVSGPSPAAIAVVSRARQTPMPAAPPPTSPSSIAAFAPGYDTDPYLARAARNSVSYAGYGG